MNTNLFANPQIFQAYQNDPSNAYAQALMQQGASTAPVRSPLEGLARALQGGVGGFFAGRNRERYQQEDEKYRKGITAALQGNDVLAALQASDQPQLQQMALEAKIRQATEKDKDPLVQVFDPNTKTMVYKPQSQAAGLQAAAPEQMKAPTTRQVGDPRRPGVLLDQQWNPQTGNWETVGARMPEPKQAPETWHTVNGPDGKPAYLESSLGNQKALPGQEGSNAKPPSASDLRGEYTKGLKDYNDALTGFYKVVEAAKDPSPAGDIALIFGYMKTLDPTSTVREGEFATAQNAGSVPTQIQSLYNKIINGERLTADQRADFVNSAKTQFTVYEERKQLADQYYSDLATRNNIKPQDVLVPYPSPPSITPNGPQNPRRRRFDAQGNEIQ